MICNKCQELLKERGFDPKGFEDITKIKNAAFPSKGNFIYLLSIIKHGNLEDAKKRNEDFEKFILSLHWSAVYDHEKDRLQLIKHLDHLDGCDLLYIGKSKNEIRNRWWNKGSCDPSTYAIWSMLLSGYTIGFQFIAVLSEFIAAPPKIKTELKKIESEMIEAYIHNHHHRPPFNTRVKG